MARVRARYNDAAFRALLLHPQVQDYVDRLGSQLAARAGEGYLYRPPSRNQVRARGFLLTATRAARLDNSRNMTLLRVLNV